MSIADLSDAELLCEIQSVVGSRNRLTAKLLAYLAEVEARRLELKEAYSSIYDFCLRRLGFSEGSAVRHIAAARACRRFPLALEFVRDGRVHMTGMALLNPHLTDSNHLELLTAATRRSKAEIELLLRTRFPRPDVPESIRPLLALREAGGCTGGTARGVLGNADCAGREAEARGADGLGARGACGSAGESMLGEASRRAAGSAAQAGSDAVDRGSVGDSEEWASADSVRGQTSTPRAERGRVAPLSADRFHVEFTMTAATKDKLDLVLDLMSHANPKRSLATAFDRALDVLLRDLEKKRLGKTSRPRKGRGVRHGNIARGTLREVYERDGVQCAFESEAGVRCTSRVFLQTDHVVARALGGSGAAHNARVLCQPHNKFEAERTFGEAHVARKIGEQRERSRGGCDGAGARAHGAKAGERGNHLRQESLDDECNESGNHLRQERLAASCSGDAPRASREVADATHGANATEVRGKLFDALTHMGFRRAETRNALARLEQGSAMLRAPLDELLREALALLTQQRK